MTRRSTRPPPKPRPRDATRLWQPAAKAPATAFGLVLVLLASLSFENQRFSRCCQNATHSGDDENLRFSNHAGCGFRAPARSRQSLARPHLTPPQPRGSRSSSAHRSLARRSSRPVGHSEARAAACGSFVWCPPLPRSRRRRSSRTPRVRRIRGSPRPRRPRRARRRTRCTGRRDRPGPRSAVGSRPPRRGR